MTDNPEEYRQVLTDYDIHLLAEGSHYRSYEKLGAHVMEVDGVHGVHFAVWAPNAKSVSVIGDFNKWDAAAHPMHLLGASGIWEIFVPGLKEGEIYKFDIASRFHRHHAVKADPYGFYFEHRPKSASIVRDIDTYRWNDADWMQNRPARNWFESPMSIYEVHLGSWMRMPEEADRFLTYRELADRLVEYVLQMGYTHIELLPVAEHPLDASWGYQTIGYFAPTSRFGTTEDFMFFVDTCHQSGIGVILDWSPAHFPKDGHGLAFFDGTCLYEHADPRQGEHRDWGTLIFNYGRNEVRNFLISNATFWLDKYHIDGLRVDAVASMLYLDYSRKEGEWIPNRYGGRENLEAIDFIKRFNEITHHYYPGVLTIAEESTAWPGVTKPVYLGGLGFDLKWNMGWMNDMLEYISRNPIHRKYHHNDLTFSLLYAFSENFVLVLSHDEVVHGKRSMLDKMPGDLWQKFANLRAFYGYMFSHPGKKLLFMGGEMGQWSEWQFDHSLDWNLLETPEHSNLQKYVRDLNRLSAGERPLHEVDFQHQGFEWIDFHDTDRSIISYIRYAKDRHDYIVVVCNFTPVPHSGYRIGVPEKCYYQEILNSDSALYGGSDLGNAGGVQAEQVQRHGRPCSISIVVPPLAVLYFKPVR
ncbi:MAG: 1,4-alpha-glucan branching protein GlgB [Nitrospiraceae bacterium]|nr:1,4-alpha-glucan branching protein GlgB [Nitrospiraceae bacterium]